MIAGCVPAFRANPHDAIVAIASTSLHDERLHILQGGDGEHVYYFAVPSRWLTGAATFETALAVSLPDHPQHRGDGIYVLETANVAVVKRQGEFLLLTDGLASLEKLARDFTLAMYPVGADTLALPLAVAGYRHAAAGTIVNRVARLATYAIAACALLYGSLTLGDALLDQYAKDKLPLRAAAEAVKRIQYTSPLSEQLAQIQAISATVVRAGGWIDGYVWTQGKGEAFEIMLPGWVSRDYIDALGQGTFTDYNIPDNLVIARKGNPDRLSKP